MLKRVLAVILGLLVGSASIYALNPSKGEVPRRPLVAPGEYDQYYGFLSGGPGGDIRVVGVPSMRLLRRIPVFEPSKRYNYEVDAEGKPAGKLKDYNFGDTHHPVLSQTKNDYDGRWLFINDKGEGQVARIDLKTFQTDTIVKLPNVQAVHGLSIDPSQSRWLAASSEFIAPIPQKVTDNPDEYKAVMTILDPATMKVKFQVFAPQQDIMDFSKDGNILFATSYNSENALTEAGAIQQEKDYLIAFNLPVAEKAVQEEKYQLINGIPVLDPENIPGLRTLIPIPKNPHGVNVSPDGRYAIVSGKLSPTESIVDIATLKVVAEPYIGLGPLHTTFDDRGNAFSTNFVESTVVKWNIEKAVKGEKNYIIDKAPVAFNPGHLSAAEATTISPRGDWLISLNKLSMTRFLDVGPDLPENNQLFNIKGDKMELIYDVPVDPEPHDAVIVDAMKITGGK